mgnify:CR=1 FL=1
MRCPVCRHRDTRVVDSRVVPDGTSIRRRRLCPSCKHRFSTLEEIELLDFTVVKNDGRRESYSGEKVRRGIQHALEKRPYTELAFKSLIHHIEQDIQKLKKREVTSQEVGEIVMRHLKKFDKVAYIRFASVYRQFEDVRTFQRELQQLAGGKRQFKKKTT